MLFGFSNGTLCELMKAEKLTPVIDRQYPLAESSAAIAYVEEGHARQCNCLLTSANSTRGISGTHGKAGTK